MNEGERIKLKYIGLLERNILSFLNYQNSKIISKFNIDWEIFKLEINKIIEKDTIRGELILKDIYTKLYEDYGSWQFLQITGNTRGFVPKTIEIITAINKTAKETMKFINKKTIAVITNIVLKKGWSIEKFTKLIPGITKSRALRIARTEVICESNKVSLESANQSGGKVLKYWIYTHDSRTRKTHKKAGIQYDKTKAIPLDQKFKVGKAELEHPADRNTNHKEEIFNCRCTLGYVRKEE